MTISAIISVWNGEAYVAESIRSVLAQSLPAVELIVVDDGSTDRTAEIVRSFPSVQLIQQKNAGTGPARNTGANGAVGDWLAFLDHDDLWVPEKLAIQSRAMVENPAAAGVLGLIQNFISPELPPEVKSRISCPQEALQGYSPSMLMVKREDFWATGGWPTSEREGVEWFIRAREFGLQFVEIPLVLAHRRLHQTNRTRIGTAKNLDYVRLAREMIARRRLREGLN